MAKFDNIGVNGKNPYNKSAAEVEEEAAKKKAEKEARLAAIKDADEAMQKEVDAEADKQKELEETALRNNGSSVETRDKNKAAQEGKSTNTVDETVINDVIAGKYGTGKARTQKLIEAGYDPDEVQSKVNETLKTSKTTKEAPKAEETDVTVEDKIPTNLSETLLRQDIPENVVSELVESDEGQESDAIIANGDPADLQNITDPEGQSILRGSYDENGNYVPYVYTAENTRLVKSKGWAAALTIISAAMSALGIAAGIPIPPINFLQFGASSNEDLARLNQFEANYEKLMNAGTDEAKKIERTREASQKANISDVEAYKDLSDEDVQKAAQVNASVGGQNTQLDVQREAQEWQARQAELDREFQKEMNNLNTDSQIAILKQQAVNQQELTKLMADVDAQRIVKKIAYAKEANLSRDELAKWLRAEQGITQFGTVMGYAGNVAEIAASIAAAFLPSDKNIKKFAYDGKAANSKMFSSKRKFW